MAIEQKSMTSGKGIRRLAAVMSLFAFLAGLLGCTKEPEYEVSQLRAIAISCSHMDRRYSYSFFLHQEEDQWLLDANCFTQDREVETEFSGKAVESGEIDTLLDILERNGTIEYARSYREPKRLFQALDDTGYGLSLTFADDARYSVSSIGTAQPELEAFFYRLAEETQ